MYSTLNALNVKHFKRFKKKAPPISERCFEFCITLCLCALYCTSLPLCQLPLALYYFFSTIVILFTCFFITLIVTGVSGYPFALAIYAVSPALCVLKGTIPSALDLNFLTAPFFVTLSSIKLSIASPVTPSTGITLVGVSLTPLLGTAYINGGVSLGTGCACSVIFSSL